MNLVGRTTLPHQDVQIIFGFANMRICRKIRAGTRPSGRPEADPSEPGQVYTKTIAVKIPCTEKDLYSETKIYILVLADFRPVFGSKSWARGRCERPRLDKRRRNQRTLARETDAKATKLKSKSQP